MTTCIAVLITCHNRRDTTQRCLASLFDQEIPQGYTMEVHLVDDGSSDGTAEMVRKFFPKTRVIKGTGSLFWTGGMLLAEQSALADSPGYFLWLNDDVTLAAGALEVLIATSVAHQDKAVVVGTTSESQKTIPSYGGQTRSRSKRPLLLSVVWPNGQDQLADTMNGNIVLIPYEVRERLGPLDSQLPHNGADFDYGFRASTAGIRIVVCPRFLGTCDPNSQSKWLDKNLPLRERWRALTSTRGLPLRPWLIFTRRHCGCAWPRYFLGPYFNCLFPVTRRRNTSDN